MTQLHDINKTGWLQLIALIPLVGWIIMIIWCATEGEKKKKPFIDMKKKVINISKPELSGKTSKKIKKAVRREYKGFDGVSARKGGLIRGIPKLATKGF